MLLRRSLRGLSRSCRIYTTTTPQPYYPVHKPYTPTTTTEPINILPENTYTQPTPKPDDHIIVAMSSGVDSSVCAALYKDYPNVHGLYMANWSQLATCTERDWKDVQRVCQDLGISSCERVNFEHEYWQDVFMPMIEKYEKGLTPNPDIGCNKFVKFGKLIDYLHKKYDGTGKDWWLVTGHYARIMKHNETGEYHLLRGLSQRKDQSYYLSSIPQSSLSKILLPIGHYIKPQIRELAHDQFKLHTATKPDSQGLCFVNPQQSNFREFLNDYIPENPGDIITEDGKVWGQHKGLWHATIGQKSSVCMPQADPQYQGIWFVSDKNYEKNQIIIVKGHDNPKLFKQTVELTQLEWLHPKEKVLSLQSLQFQHHSLLKSIPITRIIELQDKLTVELETPVRALAPGQAGVLYKGNQVLGGGMINRTM